MPDKHEVGGSSPLGPTITLKGEKMEKQQIPKIIWGCSSAGRAPALQAGGHGFESHHLHQRTKVRNGKLKMENGEWIYFSFQLSTFNFQLQAQSACEVLIENRIKKQ